MSHRGQEKSIVWEFFTINAEDPSQVTCNLCDNSLSRRGKNETKAYTTTNMNKHLKSQHQAELKEKEDELKAKKEAKEDVTS